MPKRDYHERYNKSAKGRARLAAWKQTPRGQYAIQKQNARRRGVAFELTFDEWWDIWQESGHWVRRGRRRGDYCMARRGDTGPYSKENVIIVKLRTNIIAALIKRNASQYEKFKRETDISAVLPELADSF